MFYINKYVRKVQECLSIIYKNSTKLIIDEPTSARNEIDHKLCFD